MKKYISYALILIGVIGFYLYNGQDEKATPVYESYNIVNPQVTTESNNTIYAEIRGEVRFPGVYSIKENEILKTLIDKAGGLTENADIRGINQAQVVLKNTLIEIPTIKQDFISEEKPRTIYVDIKGEINYPGVYLVPENSRMFEMIDLAGGLTKAADVSSINMSQKLYDGILIVIPKIKEKELITCYIGGEVVKPGYYQLEAGSRVSDLINKASGLTAKANPDSFNLIGLLTDGEVIIIETQVEKQMIYVSIQGEVVNPDVYYVEADTSVMELINIAGGLTKNANPNLIPYNQILVLGSIVIIPNYNFNDYQPIYQENGLININTASLEELMTLKGIGNILGQRIIDYRIVYGYFTSIEDIQLVSGIKASVYEQIKDYITI